MKIFFFLFTHFFFLFFRAPFSLNLDDALLVSRYLIEDNKDDFIELDN
jgi:hypothetical protein